MSDSSPSSPVSRTILLGAFTLSGAAALIFEVVWTRALALTLGSTTYAVSTMLATFMGGLAIGAVWGGRAADRGGNLLRTFAFCELGIGFAGILSVPMIYRLPSLYLEVYRELHLYPTLFFAAQVVLCAFVMAVPTTLMGATFPIVSRALTPEIEEMGRRVGNAYTYNTFGAMVGSLSAGFVLIPMLGLKGAAVAAGSLNLVVGLGIWALAGRRARAVGAVALSIYALAFYGAIRTQRTPTLVSFYSAHRHLDDQPFDTIAAMSRSSLTELFSRDTSEGSVRAFRTADDHLLLQIGAKIEGSTARDVTSMLLLGYLPIAAHPGPSSMLIIGLGAGVTLDAVKRYVPDVTVAEINPAVIEVNQTHGFPGVLEDVDVLVNDARNILLARERQWDVIVSNPSYPTESGVTNLFTKEYYELASSRLSPDGLYCQWLPYYLLTNDDVDLVIRTFMHVFPHATLWKAPDTLDLFLIGSRQEPALAADLVPGRVSELNRTGRKLEFVLSRSPEQLASIAASSGELNTDDHPILEFRIARNLLAGDLARLDAAER